MQKDKFKVINFIRELLEDIDKNLENFPKKDIEIKNRIRNISYDLLEAVYEANSVEDKKEKDKLIDKCIAKIKVIDFLINLSYDKQIINNKRYLKFGESMDEIIKYLIGWKKSINQGIVVGMWTLFIVCQVWVAARYVNCNSSNANFGLRNANSNMNGNNMFNSNSNTNNNNNRLRPVDSINCGYVIINYIRDNVETNSCPVVKKF